MYRLNYQIAVKSHLLIVRYLRHLFCLYVNIEHCDPIMMYFFTENVKIEKKRCILVSKHFVFNLDLISVPMYLNDLCFL